MRSSRPPQHGCHHAAPAGQGRGVRLAHRPRQWLDAGHVKAVGNYGEIFERNVGSGSPLKLPRGLNGLWNQGGLMYAIPFR
jgi:hypothetical protein